MTLASGLLWQANYDNKKKKEFQKHEGKDKHLPPELLIFYWK